MRQNPSIACSIECPILPRSIRFLRDVGKPEGAVRIPPANHRSRLRAHLKSPRRAAEIAQKREVHGVPLARDALPIGDHPPTLAARRLEPLMLSGRGDLERKRAAQRYPVLVRSDFERPACPADRNSAGVLPPERILHQIQCSGKVTDRLDESLRDRPPWSAVTGVGVASMLSRGAFFLGTFLVCPLPEGVARILRQWVGSLGRSPLDGPLLGPIRLREPLCDRGRYDSSGDVRQYYPATRNATLVASRSCCATMKRWNIRVTSRSAITCCG